MRAERDAECQAGQRLVGFPGVGPADPWVEGFAKRYAKHFRPFYDYGTVATENRLSKCSGRPLGLCGRRLPELNLIPIQVIDPGKATVGFIHSFGVNLYSLLF